MLCALFHAASGRNAGRETDGDTSIAGAEFSEVERMESEWEEGGL